MPKPKWMYRGRRIWEAGDAAVLDNKKLSDFVNENVKEAVSLTMKALEFAAMPDKRGRTRVTAWGFCDEVTVEWSLDAFLRTVFDAAYFDEDEPEGAERVAVALERAAETIRRDMARRVEDLRKRRLQAQNLAPDVPPVTCVISNPIMPFDGEI